MERSQPYTMEQASMFMAAEIERRVAIEVDRRFAAWKVHTTAYIEGQLKGLVEVVGKRYAAEVKKMRAELDERFDQRLAEIESTMLRQFRAPIQDVHRKTAIEVAAAKRKAQGETHP